MATEEPATLDDWLEWATHNLEVVQRFMEAQCLVNDSSLEVMRELEERIKKMEDARKM